MVDMVCIMEMVHMVIMCMAGMVDMGDLVLFLKLIVDVNFCFMPNQSIRNTALWYFEMLS